jgi:stage III sporulation protein AF
VLNIIALVMLIVLLEIIIPSGKTKKFVHLISGFILIIAIISPLLDLLAGDISVKNFEISTRYFIDRKEIEKKSRVLEDKHMKQITELYRKKIIEQIEQGAKQIDGIVHADGDVIINEDYKSSSFGEIKRVYLHVKLEPEEQGDRPVTEIKTEKIKIVSGKGGVGKSMVTSMLAVTMNRMGYHSAILDADVTGPSIPKAFGIKGKATGSEFGLLPVKSKTGIDIITSGDIDLSIIDIPSLLGHASSTSVLTPTLFCGMPL